MTKYFEVSITMTGKTFGSQKGYSIFNTERKTFNTIKEIKDFLSEKYGNCKREKIYLDDKNGENRQIGWIYCFNNADWSHSPVEKWRQKDWVEVKEVKSKNILIN